MILHNIILYEIKARKKSILFIIAEIALLALISIVMWQFPALAVKMANIINKSGVVMSFLGMEDKIEAVTYKDIMFSVLLLLSPVVFFRNITDMAKSIKREKYMGTGMFFWSQSVSRTKLLICKLVVGIGLLLAEITIIGILVWRFSLIGAAHVDVLNSMITERVFRAVKIIGLAGMFSLAAGFAYGCISDWKRSGSFTINLLGTGYFIAVIPNIFRAALEAVGRENMDIAFIEKISDFFSGVRRYDILYWSNPFISEDGVELFCILIYAVALALLIVAGIIIYNRKELK